MKKWVGYRVVGILFVFAVEIGLSGFAIAAGKEARVTQAVHDVRLLASNSATRPASVGDNVRPGTAVRTAAIRARSLLSRIEHWRGSARTVSSVSAKEENSIWGMAASCCTCRKVPEAARIDTAVATAAGASFTAMAEYHPKSLIKFIILEGHGSISLKHHPGQARSLHAGQMIIVRAGATKLPEPQDIVLSNLIKTSPLIAKFPPLPNLNLILREAENQTNWPPTSPLIDPTGLNVRDQRAAVRPRP